MNTPNYYAIIPSNVRYDKDLTANAKLLYGEITALANKTGICTAKNKYFADLYNVSNVSISKWINSLVQKQYLKTEIKYKGGTKEILNRYLILVNTPIKENFKDNNTSNNNTSNTPYNPPKGDDGIDGKSWEDINYNFNQIWLDYPRKEGRTKAYGYYIQWLKGRKINNEKIKLTAYQIQDAVIAYAEKVKYTEQKYIQLGSTFFNTTILDYVGRCN